MFVNPTSSLGMGRRLSVLFALHISVCAAVIRELTVSTDMCGCSRRIHIGAIIEEPSMHWCSLESSLRGFHQNVVAYSLYGSVSIVTNTGEAPRYFQLLDIFPSQIAKFYPGWRVRIYHDYRPEEPEHDLVCQTYCRHDNVDLCNTNQMIDVMLQLEERGHILPFKSEDLIELNPMNWRYLPKLDPTVDRIMARDADAEINEREQAAVQQWLDSKRTFHVMRDHHFHNEPIMGGMFGAKVFQKRAVIQALGRSLVAFGNKIGYGNDQNLLAKIFWPTVKDDAMIHDSYNCQKQWNSLPVVPFPTRRVNLTFVADTNGIKWPRPNPCPVKCRPLDHQDWKYC